MPATILEKNADYELHLLREHDPDPSIPEEIRKIKFSDTPMRPMRIVLKKPGYEQDPSACIEMYAMVVFGRSESTQNLGKLMEEFKNDERLSRENGHFRPCNMITRFWNSEAKRWEGTFTQLPWFSDSVLDSFSGLFIPSPEHPEDLAFWQGAVHNIFSAYAGSAAKALPSSLSKEERAAATVESLNKKYLGTKPRSFAEFLLKMRSVSDKGIYRIPDISASESIFILLQQHQKQLLQKDGTINLESAEKLLQEEFRLPYDFAVENCLLAPHNRAIMRSKFDGEAFNYGVLPDYYQTFLLHKMEMLNLQAKKNKIALTPDFLHDKIIKVGQRKVEKNRKLNLDFSSSKQKAGMPDDQELPYTFYVKNKRGLYYHRYTVGVDPAKASQLRGVNRQEGGKLSFSEGAYPVGFPAYGWLVPWNEALVWPLHYKSLATGICVMPDQALDNRSLINRGLSFVSELWQRALSYFDYNMANPDPTKLFYRPQFAVYEELQHLVKAVFGADLEYRLRNSRTCLLISGTPLPQDAKDEQAKLLSLKYPRLIRFMSQHGDLLTREPHIKRVEAKSLAGKGAKADGTAVLAGLEFQCNPEELLDVLKTWAQEEKEQDAEMLSAQKAVKDPELGALNHTIQRLNQLMDTRTETVEKKDRKTGQIQKTITYPWMKYHLYGEFVRDKQNNLIYRIPNCFQAELGTFEHLFLRSLHYMGPLPKQKSYAGYSEIIFPPALHKRLLEQIEFYLKVSDEQICMNVEELTSIAQFIDSYSEEDWQLDKAIEYFDAQKQKAKIKMQVVATLSCEVDGKRQVLLINQAGSDQLLGGTVSPRDTWNNSNYLLGDLVGRLGVEIETVSGLSSAQSWLRANAALRQIVAKAGLSLECLNQVSKSQGRPLKVTLQSRHNLGVSPETSGDCATEPVLVDLGQISQADFDRLLKNNLAEDCLWLSLDTAGSNLRPSNRAILEKQFGIQLGSSAPVSAVSAISSSSLSSSVQDPALLGTQARSTAASSSTSTLFQNVALRSGNSLPVKDADAKEMEAVEEESKVSTLRTRAPALFSATAKIKLGADTVDVHYDSDLHEAVRKGDLNRVQSLLLVDLYKNLHLNRWNNLGRTPLHEALLADIPDNKLRLSIIRTLLEAGANYNTRMGFMIDNNFRANIRPLNLATLTHNKEAHHLLREFQNRRDYSFHRDKLVEEKGPFPDPLTSNLCLPEKAIVVQTLASAIGFNAFNFDTIKAVLDAYPHYADVILGENANFGVHQGETILHWAVQYAHVEAVRYLLQKLNEIGRINEVLKHHNQRWSSGVVVEHLTPLDLARTLKAGPARQAIESALTSPAPAGAPVVQLGFFSGSSTSAQQSTTPASTANPLLFKKA